MKMSDVIEGLTILQKYYREDGYHLAAEHDEIYAFETQKQLSPEDAKKMFDLGWIQVDAETDDYGNAPYDPECGWVAYV